MPRSERHGAVGGPPRGNRTIAQPAKINAANQIKHAKDCCADRFGPDNRDQCKCRPGYVATEMSGEEPGAGASSTTGANPEQREKRRARRQRVRTTGDGGREQQARRRDRRSPACERSD